MFKLIIAYFFLTIILSCSRSTNTETFKKYGILVNSYYIYDFGRTNYLVFKDTTTGVITEIPVSDGVYLQYKSCKHNGFLVN